MMFFRMNTHVLGTLILVVFLLQKGHPLQQQQQQQQQEANRELIVGGAQEAPLDFYNWFVRVKNRAGVLIAPQFFITKANYADTIVPKETLSRIGFLCNEDDDITSSTTNCGQYYEDKMVEKIFIHPDYDNGGPNLMLVQLNETSTIQPSKMDHGKLALSYQTGMFYEQAGVEDDMMDPLVTRAVLVGLIIDGWLFFFKCLVRTDRGLTMFLLPLLIIFNVHFRTRKSLYSRIWYDQR
jgi:hypothetical protein